MTSALRDMKPGDLIGYSGQGWISAIINLGSYGLPNRGLSHVGIIGGSATNGTRLVFESTSLCDSPCAITGRRTRGVQAHPIDESIREYRGRVYHYPLYRKLYRHETDRLTRYLFQAVGLPYDTKGAIRSGGVGLSALESLIRGQDLSALFCSEFVASALAHIGLFQTANASRWNPNCLIRTLQQLGTFGPMGRLK